MDRRLVLTGALALVATPALAQSSPPPPTDAPAAPAPAAPTATVLPPAPAMKVAPPLTLSDAATAHIKATIAAGSLSLAISRLAVERATHPMLKRFVGFEIAEQETVASILKQMMMPGALPSPTVMPPTEAEVAGNLDAAAKAEVISLRDMKPGPAFERDYVKAEIEGHKVLLAAQESYLKAPDNAEQTAVAKLAKGMILEHLTLLDDIRKAIG